MLDKAMIVSPCVSLNVTTTTEGSSHRIFCKEYTTNGTNPAWAVIVEVATAYPRRLFSVSNESCGRDVRNRTSWPGESREARFDEDLSVIGRGRDVVRELTLHSNTFDNSQVSIKCKEGATVVGTFSSAALFDASCFARKWDLDY